jgi:Ser/Thr protein kinase RdoA (MazF antagonist)
VGTVVFGWLDGDPPRDEADWRRVAAELVRLHDLTRGHRQRPGFRSTRDLLVADRGGDVDLTLMPPRAVAACRAAWAALPELPPAVVHGDPGPGNIRIQDNTVGFLDWDESRVDNPAIDLAELPVRVLPRDIDAAAKLAAEAWEAANGWQAEPGPNPTTPVDASTASTPPTLTTGAEILGLAARAGRATTALAAARSRLR